MQAFEFYFNEILRSSGANKLQVLSLYIVTKVVMEEAPRGE